MLNASVTQSMEETTEHIYKGDDIQTGRSTSGVLCMFAGGAITWLGQRQQSVAICITEAEIVAASEGARECVWLAWLMEDLIGVKKHPTLQVDNEEAIRLAENPVFHIRTKHKRIRNFFIRELISNGEISVKKVTSEEQLADIFTKSTTYYTEHMVYQYPGCRK